MQLEKNLVQLMTGRDHAWVMADLDEEFAKARVWAEIMGMGDQEVALYPGLYVSC